MSAMRTHGMGLDYDFLGVRFDARDLWHHGFLPSVSRCTMAIASSALLAMAYWPRHSARKIICGFVSFRALGTRWECEIQ